MKLLLPSPSISSSASFDPTLCTSKSATAGCIAGILRRILCSRSLPTHPSDYITRGSSSSIDKNQQLEVEDKTENAKAAAPGIVARLMGLDSMAEINQVKPNSVSRSRSMNSVDYMHSSDQVQGKQKQVNSTLSFREMPTYLQLEDEEFFVLSFEKEGEGREFRAKQRKQRKEEKNRTDKESEGRSKKPLCVLIKEEMNRRITEKPNQDFSKTQKIEDSVCTYAPFKESSIKALERKRKKKKKANCRAAENLEHECNSEDSSPVSVLDFDQEVPTPTSSSTDEDFKLEESRRKLLPELENCGSPGPREDGNLMDNDGKMETMERKSHGLMRKKDSHSNNYLHCWDAICTLTESEMGNRSSWLGSNTYKCEELEDIAADLGLQILAQLLDELLVQLS
ncbi:hypothetical protein SLE2022_001550 [Rubroshorea leprosula]